MHRNPSVYGISDSAWQLGESTLFLTMEIIMSLKKKIKRKSVFVRQYVRFRMGRLETVCKHYRSLPT